MKTGARPRTPAYVMSQLPQSVRACFGDQSLDQKPFYFAWPEVEEEDSITVWSPLVMKLAAQETPKDSVRKLRVDADQKALKKARVEGDPRAQKKARIDSDQRALKKGKADVDLRGLKKGKVEGDLRAMKKGKMDVDLRGLKKGKVDVDLRGLKKGKVDIDQRTLKKVKNYRHKMRSMEAQAQTRREDKGVVHSKFSAGIPDGMKSTWV
jgi:hypothetical protein